MRFLQTLLAYAKNVLFSDTKKGMGGASQQLTNLFEKRYNTSQMDRDEKLKIMELYNQRKDKLAAQRHDSVDMVILCDLMFDCIYHQKEKLIKSPSNLLDEYRTQSSYNLNSLLKKVTEMYRPLIGEMFKIIATAKSRNPEAVANNFAEVLLSKGHRSKYQSEMQRVVRQLIA